MLSNLVTSLSDLEQAFKGPSNKVLSATEAFNIEIKKVTGEDIKKNLSKNDIDSMIKTIEKLSIQNEFKINILKDFPKYIYDKKQL